MRFFLQRWIRHGYRIHRSNHKCALIFSKFFNGFYCRVRENTPATEVYFFI